MSDSEPRTRPMQGSRQRRNAGREEQQPMLIVVPQMKSHGSEGQEKQAFGNPTQPDFSVIELPVIVMMIGNLIVEHATYPTRGSRWLQSPLKLWQAVIANSSLHLFQCTGFEF